MKTNVFSGSFLRGYELHEAPVSQKTKADVALFRELVSEGNRLTLVTSLFKPAELANVMEVVDLQLA
jgi:hypothetical protein